MSLIEEALRRLQDPNPNVPQTEPAKSKTQSVPHHDIPTHPSWSVSSTSLGRLPDPSILKPSRVPVFVGGLILASMLVLLIAGAFWIGRVLGQQHSQGNAPQAETTLMAISPSVGATQPALTLDGKREQAKALEDPAKGSSTPSITERPFRMSTSSRKASDRSWILNGVMEGRGQPYAMINGTILGIGDRIGDATLLNIADGSVILREDNGGETTLKVTP